MRSLNHSRPARFNRGFSLVEAAIVLGVVGLVIGGIWVAASAVQTEFKTNQIVTGVMRAAEIARPVITARVLAADPGGVEGLTRTLLNGKLDGFNGDAKDSWGGDFAIGAPMGVGAYLHLDAYDPGLGYNVLTVFIGPLPQAMCIRVLHKFRATMESDKGAALMTGVMSENSSSNAYIGSYTPAIYNGGTASFPADSTMCLTTNITLRVFFQPLNQ